MRDRLARILGITSESEGLGAMERDARSDTASSVPMGALESGFFGGLGLCCLILLSASRSFALGWDSDKSLLLVRIGAR